MGLAYNLDVATWDDFGEFLPNMMIALANTDPSGLSQPTTPQADIFTGLGGQAGWEHRFCGSAGLFQANTQYIFPTGEYIVRDMAFINGRYIFVGSYKAYFRDLYGVGNHGYAWDGCIWSISGYSTGTCATAPCTYNPTTRAFIGLWAAQQAGFGFMPMRMPMDISPGVIGDAAAIAADSSVGLQAIDIWKGGTDTQVGAPSSNDTGNIKIVTCGFQKVGDPVTQGMVFTDIDYVGFMWASQLQKTVSQDQLGFATVVDFTSQPYTGGDPTAYPYNAATVRDGSFVLYQVNRESTYQTSWRATSNYSLYLPVGYPPTTNTRLANLEDWCAVGVENNGGAGTYTMREWNSGYLPNGTTWNGSPAIPVDVSCLAMQYFPRRFMDITAWSETTKTGAGGYSILSPWMITGDVSIGGDPSVPTPTILGTVPMWMGCSLPSEFANIAATGAPAGDKINIRPYMMMHCAGRSTRMAPSGALPNGAWAIQGTHTPAINLPMYGAYGAFNFVPYELMTTFITGGYNPSQRSPLMFIAVNEVEDAAGDKGCAVFASEVQPQVEGNDIRLILGNNQTPATGIDLPEKWIGKLMQSRTFTVEEEDRSKEMGHLEGLVLNSNNGEYVGVLGNYQRYGLDLDPSGEVSETKQQGANSRQCYGLLGWESGVEPIVYLYDSSRGWFKGPTVPVTDPNYANPANYSNVQMNKGDTFNGHFTLDPTSTTRKAVWAAWDNDRDQWMFLFSDPTRGIGSMSATSTFQDTITSTAFLDQTVNFAEIAPTETTNYQTALWTPFLMTNNMDGVVIYGGDDETNSKGGEIWGYTGDGAANKYWVYAVQQSTGSQTPDDSWYQGGSALTLDFIPSTLQWFLISGSTGRTARVWVDYILLDGADAVIATKIRERGMKVTIEAVEWFKRKIINSGDLNIKQEEIEMWMREQQDEFSQMMQDAERQGRVRKRKKQVSAYGLDMLENLNTDFEDKEVQEFMKEYLPQSRPPTPEEQAIEKQRKGGYAPFSKNYYDEVFDN